ncbi:MAG: flippase-like domain-containing protein [Gemmatimonadota bacterium]|nr:flippase-like domain-containing protein [Gemmatimonadota bacterium]
MNKAKVGKLVRVAVSAAIIVLLIVFARKVDWGQAWSAMIHASRPLLLAALAANLLTLVFRAVRWWILLRAVGSPSLALATRATFAGAGLNNVLIANGGDAARILFVTRKSGVASARILATAALDRLFDPIGFVIMLVAGMMMFTLPPQFESLRWPALIALVAIAVALVWLARTAPEPDVEHVPERRAIPRDWKGRARAWFGDFGGSMRELATGARIVPLLILTIAAWLGQLATFAYAARAVQMHLPIQGTLAGLLAVNVSLIVRATPGNVGFFQFAYALAVAPFGVVEANAVGVAVLIQALQIIPTTIIGVALAPEFIFHRKKKEPATV